MEPLTDFEFRGDLETSLSFLRAALDSTADGILVVDRAGKIVLYNARFIALWSIPPAVLLDRDDARALRYVTEQLIDPQAFMAKVTELYAAPEESSFDIIKLTGDRTFERWSQPHWLGDAVVGRVWSFRDITQRARTEDQLRQKSAELQAVLDNVVDPVIACGADKQLFLANGAARQVLGAKPGMSLEQLCSRLGCRDLEGTPLQTCDLPLQRALEGEIVQDLEARVAGDDGVTRVLRISAAPIRGNAGEVIAAVAVGRDVTHLVELDALKDQFVRVAAHELKTPLAVMKSYAQLALKQTDGLPTDVVKTLKGIDRGADRINKIVRSLLDISQLAVGPLKIFVEPLDFGALIEAVVRSEAFARAQTRILLTAPRGLVVAGNRARLTQVLDAVIDNAIRYSPNGGEIRVTLRSNGPEAIVEVEDHGIGIGADQQNRIFERFYRAHADLPEDYGGMGVGLFLSREIVRLHHGRMWFQSVDGVGSRFFIALPRIP